MDSFQNAAFELIDRFNEARGPKQIEREFRRFLDAEGFGPFGARTIGNPLLEGQASVPEVYDGPREFSVLWYEKGGVRHDPNVVRALSTQRPFLWRSTMPTSKKARDILNQARIFGLEDGVCLPVHSLDRQPACVAVCGSRANALGTSELLTFGLVATHFFVSWSSFFGGGDKEVEQLTDRERDVLYCAAAGLTGERMREQLGVGSNTLKTHMSAIRRKLGANSMAHAVAKGIHYGQIAC